MGIKTSIFFSAATLLFADYVIACVNSAPTSTIDQSALLALKSHICFGPENVFLEKNWTAESPVCSWTGVVCSPGSDRVTTLDISYMDLNGTIPPQLGNLSFLTYLDLSRNFFRGNFPEALAELRRLKFLDLRTNNFSGAIPPSIFSSLLNLQFLYLSRNGFSGSIPSSVSRMSQLKELDLKSNALEGSIPGEIGDLRFLTVLDLQLNRLSGLVPPSIYNLSLLEYMALTYNSLTGNLPADIGFYLPNLKGLYLSKNEFDGPIPASLGKCSQLKFLSLSYNAFAGVIPREIGNLTFLEDFIVADNELTGAIPAEIGNLQGLKTFSAYANRLSGSIPESIFNISTVQHILCAQNELSGKLPPNMGKGIPNVEEINLSLNNLSGTIPDTISNASKLIMLCMSSNSFTGFIPETLGNLRSLQKLCLSTNNLKVKSSSTESDIITSLTNCRNLTELKIGWNPLYGMLPASIGNLSTHLKIFDAGQSRIRGDIPEEIGNLSSVFRLNLFGNDLTGFIPRTVDGLVNLQELFLDNNRIEGSLPDTICNLLDLGVMFLDHNQISGLVPSCIGNNTSLRLLTLDSNNFSSSLPPSLWTLKDLLRFTASSNSLSGYIPPEIGNLGAAINIDLSMNSFSGNIPTTIGRLQNLLSLSLARNKLEGPIPDSLGRALSLEMLDLSNNKLTGGIPLSLEKLVYLKLFNVSFNGLNGRIPTGGPFQNFTASSFLSNAALCGASRFEMLPCPISKSNRRFQFIVYIILGIFPIILISIYLAIFLLMRCGVKRSTAFENATSPSLKHKGISYHELQTITNGFSEGNLLAVGSYSSVYEVTLSNGTHAAVKVFNFKLGRSLETFDTECQMLSNLRHRNLTSVITSCTTWDLEFGALVLEYMPNGSLEKWLYSHNYCLGILQRLDIMIDVASALDYLHNDYHSPVVHCDVKPSNVLLDEDMVGHLCDFGIAKLLGVRDGIVRTNTIGTVGYLSPEYGNEGSVSTKCDVYSYGIMLMETFTRRRPSDDMFTGDITLRSWIKDSFPNSITEVADCNLVKAEEDNFEAKLQCVSSLMEVAFDCTATSPGARMNMHDVLPAVKKLRNQLAIMSCCRSSSKHKVIT